MVFVSSLLDYWPNRRKSSGISSLVLGLIDIVVSWLNLEIANLIFPSWWWNPSQVGSHLWTCIWKSSSNQNTIALVDCQFIWSFSNFCSCSNWCGVLIAIGGRQCFWKHTKWTRKIEMDKMRLTSILNWLWWQEAYTKLALYVVPF